MAVTAVRVMPVIIVRVAVMLVVGRVPVIVAMLINRFHAGSDGNGGKRAADRAACRRRNIRAAPKSGNSGISQIWSRKFTALLPFQQVDFIRQHGFLIAEQSDEDAQPDGGLSHGVDNHEDGENLSRPPALLVMRKGDQIDVHGVEDELDVV